MDAQDDELVAVEGDEEVQYVLLELPHSIPPNLLTAGTPITVKDLDSDNPTLVIGEGEGYQLQGTYQETLGTTMLFQHQPRAAGAATHGGAAGAQGCSFQGLTETKIVFKEAQQDGKR